MKTHFSSLIYNPEEIRLAEMIKNARTVEECFAILKGQDKHTLFYVVKEKFKLTQKEVLHKWLVWAGWRKN